MDSFGKAFSYFLGIATIMAMLFVFYSSDREKLSQSAVSAITAEFVTEVCNNGKITLEMWDEFMRKLIATGESYSAELMHLKKVIEPKYDDNGLVKFGEYVEYTNEYYTDDILVELQQNENTYYFSQGDYFNIVVVSSTDTEAGNVRSIIFGADAQNTSRIYAEDGGVIRDEDY